MKGHFAAVAATAAVCFGIAAGSGFGFQRGSPTYVIPYSSHEFRYIVIPVLDLHCALTTTYFAEQTHPGEGPELTCTRTSAMAEGRQIDVTRSHYYVWSEDRKSIEYTAARTP